MTAIPNYYRRRSRTGFDVSNISRIGISILSEWIEHFRDVRILEINSREMVIIYLSPTYNLDDMISNAVLKTKELFPLYTPNTLNINRSFL